MDRNGVFYRSYRQAEAVLRAHPQVFQPSNKNDKTLKCWQLSSKSYLKELEKLKWFAGQGTHTAPQINHQFKQDGGDSHALQYLKKKN